MPIESNWDQVRPSETKWDWSRTTKWDQVRPRDIKLTHNPSTPRSAESSCPSSVALTCISHYHMHIYIYIYIHIYILYIYIYLHTYPWIVLVVFKVRPCTEPRGLFPLAQLCDVRDYLTSFAMMSLNIGFPAASSWFPIYEELTTNTNTRARPLIWKSGLDREWVLVWSHSWGRFVLLCSPPFHPTYEFHTRRANRASTLLHRSMYFGFVCLYIHRYEYIYIYI